MTTVGKAIKALNPSAEFTYTDIDNITWVNNTTPISKTDIEAKQAALTTDYNNKEYQRKRAAEYPSIADQLDDLYHNGIDGWKATIKATKDKYPKP